VCESTTPFGFAFECSKYKSAAFPTDGGESTRFETGRDAPELKPWK